MTEIYGVHLTTEHPKRWPRLRGLCRACKGSKTLVISAHVKTNARGWARCTHRKECPICDGTGRFPRLMRTPSWGLVVTELDGVDVWSGIRPDGPALIQEMGRA